MPKPNDSSPFGYMRGTVTEHGDIVAPDQTVWDNAPDPLDQQLVRRRRFIPAILLWHATGACLAAMCFGLATIAWTLGQSDLNEMVAGMLFMGVGALFTMVMYTPVALLILAGWAALAALIPALERGAAWRRAATLSVVAAALTAPFLIAMWLLLGMQLNGETRRPIEVILSTMSGHWQNSLMYFPAMLGWFVLPRLIVPSLRAPLLRPRGGIV